VTDDTNDPIDASGTAGQDGFRQEDLDAIIKDAGKGEAEGDAASAAPASDPAGGGGDLSSADIEAILTAAGAEAEASEDGTSVDAGSTTPQADGPPDAGGSTEPAGVGQTSLDADRVTAQSGASTSDVAGYKPAELGDGSGAVLDPKRVTMLNDVKLGVRIQLGRTRMLVEDVLKLGEGSVVELDKLAGDPVDVLVNDRLIARGEVLVLNDNFCVRVSEVLSHDPHRITQ
jgi:flagellar motor switch protein FliN/FliY